MDPEYGDPYINWGEENAAREDFDNETEEPTKGYEVFDLQSFRDEVVKLLVTENDFTSEEAESAVEEDINNNFDRWNENADARQLAEFLASDDDDA